MPPTLMPALSPNFLGGWCVWQVVWPLSLRTFKVDWYPTRFRGEDNIVDRKFCTSFVVDLFDTWFRSKIFRFTIRTNVFQKKKRIQLSNILLRFRLSDRKDSRGIFLEYLSPFVSPLLSRITARAKTSAKVTPVQSILRHIEPHLFARSNLENIHASFIPTVRSSFPVRPSLAPPSLPTCLSSATPQSPRNPPLTKRATRSYVTCYPTEPTKNISLTRFARIGNTIGIVIRRVIASCTSTLHALQRRKTRTEWLAWMDGSLSLWVNNVLHLLSYVLASPYFLRIR